MGTNHASQVSFADEFTDLLPLIHDEWPGLDDEALRQTKGDYDLVVALIATETEHTKLLVRKQLEEIRQVRSGGGEDEVRRLRQVIDRLQSRSQEMANYVRRQMLEDAKTKMHEKPLIVLLLAVTFGVLFGFVLRGLGRRR